MSYEDGQTYWQCDRCFRREDDHDDGVPPSGWVGFTNQDDVCGDCARAVMVIIPAPGRRAAPVAFLPLTPTRLLAERDHALAYAAPEMRDLLEVRWWESNVDRMRGMVRRR